MSLLAKKIRYVTAFLFAAACLGGAAATDAATTDPVDVTVYTSCKKGVPMFRVVNTGNKWPGLATLKVLMTEDDSPLISRKLRMAQGQQLEFKVKKAKEAGEIGLYIEPNWYQRGFEYDAKVSC